MGSALYTLLTWVICLVANLRDRWCASSTGLRWDRTIEWDEPEKDVADGVLYAECCDCGLTHLFVLGKSVTPERPRKYRYRLRAGRGPNVSPNLRLGVSASVTFHSWCAKESA